LGDQFDNYEGLLDGDAAVFLWCEESGNITNMLYDCNIVLKYFSNVLGAWYIDKCNEQLKKINDCDIEMDGYTAIAIP